MKASDRKQLPSCLYKLLLSEADDQNSILVFLGEPAVQFYTPFFVNNELVAVFYSWQKRFVHSRQRLESKTWPCERVFIDAQKLIKHWMPRKADIYKDIQQKNQSAEAQFIDPRRDARLPWNRNSWIGDSSFSNIDVWADNTQKRLLELKNGTATTIMEGRCHMAVMGVMISVLSCLHANADASSFLHDFDTLIGQEADTYLRGTFNYAWKYPICLKEDIQDYPYIDYLDEHVNVCVDVPEMLSALLKANIKSPLYRGKTYVGIRRFMLVARAIFISEWKQFAVRLFVQFPKDDPAFTEFCSRVKYREKTLSLNPTLIIPTSALLLFPQVSQAAPACMKKMFSSLPLKHYARWQLGELAVDMGWSLNNLMTYYTDTQPNRREVTAVFQSYTRKRVPTRNRCKIYRKNAYCPYSYNTYSMCLGEQNNLPDIEDLSPALFFQKRITLNVST